MNVYIWIVEGITMWNFGVITTRSQCHWRGIQNVLWPVTLVVRAIARDPIRDPKPIRLMSPEEIRALEAEVGVGQVEPDRMRAYSVLAGPEKATYRPVPKAPSGRSLAFSGMARADERDTIAEQSESLLKQYPDSEIKNAYQRLHHELRADELGSALGTLRWMQAYVCRRGPQGYEETSGGRERYDELREALWASRECGDRLMVTRAHQRLTEWCARHHDPRQGRSFPMPDWLTYRPWTADDGNRWTDAFGGFQ